MKVSNISPRESTTLNSTSAKIQILNDLIDLSEYRTLNSTSAKIQMSTNVATSIAAQVFKFHFC